MSAPVCFSYNGKKYTLEFSRATASALSRRGFDPDKLADEAYSMIPMLWYGAFAMHHSSVKHEVLDEIWSHMTNKTKLLTKLAELYHLPLAVMMEEPDEDDEGNVTWTAEE